MEIIFQIKKIFITKRVIKKFKVIKVKKNKKKKKKKKIKADKN